MGFIYGFGTIIFCVILSFIIVKLTGKKCAECGRRIGTTNLMNFYKNNKEYCMSCWKADGGIERMKI